MHYRKMDRSALVLRRGLVALSIMTLMIGALGLVSDASLGAVTPANPNALVTNGQRIHENSTAVPVWGFRATSDTGSDSLVSVNVTLVNSGSFTMSDIRTISTNQSRSGVALYRDDGTDDDKLDQSDTPLDVPSFSVSSNAIMFNISSESVPTSISGSHHWFIVLRTSSSISSGDRFVVRLPANAITFSDDTKIPSSTSNTNTLQCGHIEANYLGTDDVVPVGEKGIDIDHIAVQGISLFSGISDLEVVTGIQLELHSISGFDPWMDLYTMGNGTSSGASIYMDDGASSSDEFDPSDDTRVLPTSMELINSSGYWTLNISLPENGSATAKVPGNSSGSYDMFIVLHTSSNITHGDTFYSSTPPWSMEIKGADGNKVKVMPVSNRSHRVKADTRPPDLSTCELRMQATTAYFYDADSDLNGTDTIYYNSVSGEGLGQSISANFHGFTEDFPDELRGEPAFDKRPDGPKDTVDDNSMTVGYTITQNGYADNPITFTLRDKVGHETTWDVYFIEDNDPPTVSNLSVQESSKYIYVDQPTRNIYFRPNMLKTQEFHITGSAREPAGASGLDKVTFDPEGGLAYSPEDDNTPSQWNGTYGVNSLSQDVNSPLYVRIYDNVLNNWRIDISYHRVTSLPKVEIVTPSEIGTNVSGIHRVVARVDSEAPVEKVEFSAGDGGWNGMTYTSASGDWRYYAYDWDTFDSGEGSMTIKVRATDSISGTNYNTTWVDVNNYPLWGYFTTPDWGDALRGVAPISLRVSEYTKAVQFYVDGTLFDSFSGKASMINKALNTSLFSDGPHILKASLQGFSGRSTSITMPITIDNTPPSLSGPSVDYPGSQTAAKVGDRVRLHAMIYDNQSGLEECVVHASPIGGDAAQLLFDDGAHNDKAANDGYWGSELITVDGPWAFHTIRYYATDRAGNLMEKRIEVPVDPKPPFVEDAWVDYPGEQGAAKTGDDIRIMARLSDNTAPIYLTLVLDNSGSMAENNKIDSLKRAAKSFINNTRDIDYVSIWRFYEVYEDGGPGPDAPGIPKKDMNFTLMDDNGKQQARNLIDSIRARAGTPIWDSIGNATKYTLANADSTPVVVAFTDGADDYNRELHYQYEEGSANFCPWHDWNVSSYVTTHWGKYEDRGYTIDNNTLVNNVSGRHYWVESEIYQFREGLLNSPIPIYTIGLGLEHHEPPNSPLRLTAPNNYEYDEKSAYWQDESGTVEYNLWRIASTSAGGAYYYAPSATQLETIYRNIGRSIYSTDNPARIVKGIANVPLDVTKEAFLYDDGEHEDGLADDGLYGSPLITVPTMDTQERKVLIEAVDWADNVGLGEADLTIDNQLPEVETPVLVRYPDGRGSVSDHERFHMQIKVWDAGSDILRVKADGTELGFYPPITFNNTGLGNDLNGSDDNFTSIDIVPNTGGAPSKYYFVRIEAKDLAGNSISALAQVLVVNDREAPVVEMVNPTSGGHLTGEDDIYAIITDDGDIRTVRFTLSEGSEGEELMKGLLTDQGRDIYKASVDVSSLPDGTYILEVVANDTAGRLGSSGPVSVRIDNTYPALTVFYPTNGSSVSGDVDFVTNSASEIDEFLDGPVTFSIDGGPYIDVADGFDTGDHRAGYHQVEVRALDITGKTDSVFLDLYFDNYKPQVELVAPSYGSTQEGRVSILAHVDDGGVIDYVEASLYKWGNRTGPVPPGPTEKPFASVRLKGPGDGPVTRDYFEGMIDTEALMDGRYLLVVRAQDRLGEEGFAYSYMPVDNNAPELNVISPVDGAAITGNFTPEAEVIEPFLSRVYFIFRGEDHDLGTTLDLERVPDGSYNMRFVALDTGLRSTIVDLDVFVDRSPPMVDMLSPADNSSHSGELKVLVSIRENSGVRHVFLVMDGYSVALGEPIGEGDLYSISLNLSSFNRSAHKIVVRAENMAGLVGSSQTRTVFKDYLDTDGDGVRDPYDDDPYDPRVHGDIDGDGFGSFYDDDDDGDGVLDIHEPPGDSHYPSGVSKGYSFAKDPTEWLDTDGDGITRILTSTGTDI